jgi:UDP-N-acetylglucosamine 2-epimerase (non-hydrolysing)
MKTEKLRVTTIVGTRPELIRLSEVITKFDLFFEHRIIHTGQNSQYELQEVFFKDLKIRTPDNFFNISTGSLGNFFGALFLEVENEFQAFPPDAVVILGDTNSSLAGIIAKRRGIPVYHLEAGNRSFDANVPEEINRKIVDHFADYNLVYSQHAKENLLREGLHTRSICHIGSPLNEVLSKHQLAIQDSRILSELNLQEFEYFLVSAHRQENIDLFSRLEELIHTLNEIAIRYELPIIVSTHPRMRQKLSETQLDLNPLINFCEPFGFFDYNKLQKSAKMVLSDSGSISEEASILGFRAVTIRNSIERPEALDSGSIILSGINKFGVLDAISAAEILLPSKSVPADYEITNTSDRVTAFILSTVRNHNFWNNIREGN